MPAHKGNKYAVGYGRPLKFKSAEELQVKIDRYFDACALRAREKSGEPLSEDETAIASVTYDVFPTVSGLAVMLGTDRTTLINYENKESFFDTIKAAKVKIEAAAEQRLGSSACTGTIFSLKNNYNWRDRQEVETTHNLSQDLFDLVKDTTGPTNND